MRRNGRFLSGCHSKLCKCACLRWVREVAVGGRRRAADCGLQVLRSVDLISYDS